MRQFTFIVLSIICMEAFGVQANSAALLGPGLEQRVSASDSSVIPVVVFMNFDERRKITDLSRLEGLNRSGRIKRVLGELLHESTQSYETVYQFLNANSTTPVNRYRIVPAFDASLKAARISELTGFPSVRLVVENLALDYVVPVSESPAQAVVSAVSNELALLKVPSLWQKGLKGAGTLICSFDTGVEWDHPALADKWRGNDYSLESSWFSVIAPQSMPYDAAGHGTHTMGLMVGATEVDTFGVAPEAQWITAGVVDQGRPLQTTLADIIKAFEWSLNPDGDTTTTDDVPDVILNSWGIPKGLFAPCDQTFTEVIDVVEAAGIVTIFAAGNEGPDPMTLRSPADQALTPLNTLAVGAVDLDKSIASFSSRGPSSCDQNEIKPEVVAPGVSVRSSQKGGGYSYMSGTSMAAPFVAGLVALMRQYNPDATVTEIKNALLQATEDLGAAGEDNIYGHGLIDASRLLDYLPLPTATSFQLSRIQIDGDGVAWPGETFGLDVFLTNSSANVPEVSGRLRSGNPGVVISDSMAVFYFGPAGSSTQTQAPFVISYDSGFYHGQRVGFTLILGAPDGRIFDTIDFELSVGVNPSGSIADQGSNRIQFSVSDFAQFGFGVNSIYNAGGAGFRVDGSENLLYEAGIVLGRNALQLSSSIRDAQGKFHVSDYEPTLSLGSPVWDNDGGWHITAGYADTHSEIPIPIELNQETISFPDDPGFIIFRFQMRNITPGWLTGLHFGFFTDFDMSASADRVVYDPAADLMYQFTDGGPVVGLVGLRNLDSFTAMENGNSKRGFSRADKFDLISGLIASVDSTVSGDMMMSINSGSFAIEAWSSNEVAFALVIGRDPVEFYNNAERARQRFDLATSVDDNNTGLMPSDLNLNQNYPNPFNPTTTISFSLVRASDVTLTVYNALGQQVKQLVNSRFPAGSHEVVWDGTDARNNFVASGVYFYRLSDGETSHSRKMLLLK